MATGAELFAKAKEEIKVDREDHYKNRLRELLEKQMEYEDRIAEIKKEIEQEIADFDKGE